MNGRERRPDERTDAPQPGEARIDAAPPAADRGIAAATHLLRSGGVSNQAAAALVSRQEFHGPSYARSGPGVLDDRRGALTPQSRLGETEVQLSGEIAKSVGWIGDGASKAYALAEDFRKSEREGKPFMGDNTLDFASRLQQIGDALTKLVAGFGATHAKVKDADASLERFEQMDTASKALGVIINSLGALAAGKKANDKLEAFGKHPDQKSAEEWADSVVDSFDAFGKVIGALDLPPGLSWIVDYFQGLLGAPKAYVGFFKAVMRQRYGELDRTVGRLESYHEFIKEGEKIVWAGPACSLVSASWWFDQYLQGWIRKQQDEKRGGWTDLYVYGPAELALLLMARLDADTSVTAEQKERWGAWLSSRSR